MSVSSELFVFVLLIGYVVLVTRAIWLYVKNQRCVSFNSPSDSLSTNVDSSVVPDKLSFLPPYGSVDLGLAYEIRQDFARAADRVWSGVALVKVDDSDPELSSDPVVVNWYRDVTNGLVVANVPDGYLVSVMDDTGEVPVFKVIKRLTTTDLLRFSGVTAVSSIMSFGGFETFTAVNQQQEPKQVPKEEPRIMMVPVRTRKMVLR